MTSYDLLAAAPSGVFPKMTAREQSFAPKPKASRSICSNELLSPSRVALGYQSRAFCDSPCVAHVGPWISRAAAVRLVFESVKDFKDASAVPARPFKENLHAASCTPILASFKLVCSPGSARPYLASSVQTCSKAGISLRILVTASRLA